MASSVFLDLGDQGGPFSGQMLGPAADNTAAPPYSFTGDTDTGYASSAANTLALVAGGTTRLSVSTSAVTSTVPVAITAPNTGSDLVALTVTQNDGQNYAIDVSSANYGVRVIGAVDPFYAKMTSLGTTSTNGVRIENATAATGGTTVQMSPRLLWRGNAWDTAASQTVDFFAENLPASAATPTGTWKLGYSLNGAAATYPLTVTSGGTLQTLSGIVVGGNINPSSKGLLLFTADAQWGFTNNANSAGIGLDFATDATLKIRTRAQTGDAQLSAASVRGNAVAFASLPATPVEGMIAAVTNSSTNTWGAAADGAGANHVLVYYNGSAWNVIGK